MLAAAALAVAFGGTAAGHATAASVDVATAAAGRLENGIGPVAAAGDVNGDGYGDVIVSHPFDAARGQEEVPDPRSGAYVVFGRPALGVVDLARLGPTGFRIVGPPTVSADADRVAGAGDFNGDGLSDVVLTLPRAEPFFRRIPGSRFRREVKGAAYVVFGTRSPSDVDLGSLGARGAIVRGIGSGAAASAGDFNGDGHSDLVVGDDQSTTDGGVHVVYGGATGTLDVGALRGRGVSFPGAPGDLVAGRAVAGAGDVNGDGLGDVVAGAPISVGAPVPEDAGEIYGPGAAYVIFGRASGRRTRLDRLGSGGFRIAARSFGLTGWTVAGAGDVNGDGRDDVVVGAPVHRPARRRRVGAGAAFVVFGGSAARVDVDRLGRRGFAIRGHRAVPGAGTAVAPAGDLDRDGLADLLVGAIELDSDREHPPARAYVVHGRTGTADDQLRHVDASPRDLALRGLPTERVGSSLAATDFDGDGRAELILGAGWSCAGGARADNLLGERWGARMLSRGTVFLYSPGRAGAPPGILGGGPGDDVLPGTDSPDRIAGRAGDDRIAGGRGGDCLFGERGADRLSGGPQGDALLGGPGRDALAGQSGPDWLRGDSGDDALRGGPGQDGLDGGPGDDANDGGAGPDLVEDGPGDDRLIGGPGEDLLRDGSGRNVLRGGPGHDGLVGGRGRDVLDGGAGDDVLSGDSWGNEGGAADRLDGGPGDDDLYGEAGRDVMLGGAGNDRLHARDGRIDVLRCGAGRDRVRADRRDRLHGCEAVEFRSGPFDR